MKKRYYLKYLFLITALLFSFSQRSLAQSVVASGYNFTASSRTFSYLSSGTRVTAVEVDDGYTTIPIGFTFRFCGANYTDVTVCSNGWLRFGTGVGSAVPNWNYNATPNSGIEPAVYALYEDISGVGGTSTYVTTGTAPNRIFTWECRNYLWDYAASTPSVSFQVLLYEATGVVECIYKQESGSVSLGSSGGATIGIGKSSTDWQVLNNVSSNPTSSSSTYTANLSSVPATGQSYAWDPGAPCASPSGLATTLVNSTHVDFSWNAAAASVGYEYVIDQNSAAPTSSANVVTTTSTSASASALQPSSLYYIHLRNQCGTNNYSQWVTISFNTLPPCVIGAPGIQIPQIDSNSATVTWPTVSTSIEYEYIVKTDNTPPSSGSSGTTTTTNQVNLTSLQSGKTYYIFLRVKCSGNDSSAWIVDSVYVPIPCRAPNVEFNDLSSNRVVTFWSAPLTAYEYEIINSSTPISNPTSGIKTTSTSRLFSFLDEATEYYVYARSYCEDKTIKTVSKWSTTTYTTWKLGVDNISGQVNQLFISPNPVHDRVIVMVDAVDHDGKISIMDMTGKLLRLQTVDSKRIIIDVNDLAQGLYIVQYTDRNNTLKAKVYKQ
ncbi:MAG: T9SS type A sorting domain-containing protein [Chitinophagaceae bacterium]|nr:T9SS type A sorting domain-containing protein [Chitinophagaceae bacterium]MCB9045505.1 T9SS type A sorting domain-containing protein [Chitinophagales bacterium]